MGSSSFAWLGQLVRIVGVSTPYTAWVVQAQAECRADQTDRRLKALEDPIGSLHKDLLDISQRIYEAIRMTGESSIALDPADYGRFGRVLAILEAADHIKGAHTIGSRFTGGLRVISPDFMLYMCSHYEDDNSMAGLIELVDNCERGKSINVQEAMAEMRLPHAVVMAVFQLFEAKGLGFCSKETGSNQYYIGRA